MRKVYFTRTATTRRYILILLNVKSGLPQFVFLTLSNNYFTANSWLGENEMFVQKFVEKPKNNQGGRARWDNNIKTDLEKIVVWCELN